MTDSLTVTFAFQINRNPIMIIKIMYRRRKEMIMKSTIGSTVFFFILLVWAAVAPAQDFFVFPGQGQSQEQMERG